MATIFVEGLSLPARVGVYKRERGKRQPLKLDIELAFLEVAQAAESEQLADTLNYEDIVELARAVVARRHYALVETLATTIAKELLDLPGVQSARVRLRKLGCLPEAEAAGTEVRLEGSSADGHPAPIDALELAAAEPLVIVGAGVAGLAAALWCWRLGYAPLLVDPADKLGGQLHHVYFEMIDMPGLPPLTGAALARRLWRQLPASARWHQARLAAVSTDAEQCTLTLEDDVGVQRELHARALILATGLRRRRLRVPGERELLGRGILPTASREIDDVAGQRVVVIGGGDGACENALKLARRGARVTLVHRGAELSARRELEVLLTKTPRVALRLRAEVVRFRGAARLEAVELKGGDVLPARRALVRTGWLPNSEELPARWLDQRGYVRCDANLLVSGEHHVFVAGDLRAPVAPSVAASSGDGANAAKAAVEHIERCMLSG